jgi:tyrosinase
VADLVIRQEVEYANVDALRDGYGKLQTIAANDNRSWVFWAELHGFNQYDCWHHSRVGPGRGTEFSYDLFLPWHRAYLTSFDHIAREQNPAAILSWWDWTSTAAHDHGLPASYTDPEVNGQPNPLASGPTPDMPDDPARRTRRFPGDPSELPSMTQARPELGLNLSINDILALPQFADFTSQLQNVHDYIHGWTGGTGPDGVGGDMGVVATSAFDPIFWAHHAMIDRLWYLWQLKWGTNNVPPDYLDKTLAPFSYTVRDVLDVQTLGYDYASSVTTSPTAEAGHG